ncbi:MAG: hypothetical protein KBC56_04840 [Flavobacterium sp.]|nr:hypothetical protein [Flavobacterium sp.]
MNTAEKKLILEFMGFIFIDYKGMTVCNGHKTAVNIGQYKDIFDRAIDFTGIKLEDIKTDFVKDWSVLMPVVEKIESLGSCQVEIIHNWCRIGYKDRTFDSRDIFRPSTKIDSVYKIIVYFIKWYNQQNQ